MSNASNPLLELTKARLREFFREKGVLFWVFGFPLLMAIGLGLAFRAKPADLPRVAVVGTEMEGVAQALLSSKSLVAVRGDAHAARRSLAQSQVDVIVQLDASRVTYLFDPQQEKAQTARSIADGVVQRAAGRVDPVTSRDLRITDLGSRYIDFLMPGLIAMNLMGTSMWGVGYSLVLARKRKLLRRFAVTPMQRWHFLLSYFLARSVFLVLEVGILLLFGHFVFQTPLAGGVPSMVFLSLLGAASFAGISLLLGARIDNTEVASGWMNLVQLPMWLLSGAFFSYERFPEWLHWPIRILPLTALCDALRAVANQGASLLSLGGEILILAVWGLAGFAIALRTFRWQ